LNHLSTQSLIDDKTPPNEALQEAAKISPVVPNRVSYPLQLDSIIQNRPVGKNTLADITKEMASFLKLENPDSYTSHSFRRSGATLLAESGVSTEALRQYGGWKNASTAQVYIESTESNKKRLSNAVLDSPSPTKKLPQLRFPERRQPFQYLMQLPAFLTASNSTIVSIFTIHIHQ